MIRITPDLVIKARTSDKAFTKLMSMSERMIYNFAWSYKIKNIDFDELVQEGRIIVWKCVQKYDYRKGVLFSTYLIKALKNAFKNQVGKQFADRRILNMKAESLQDIKNDNLPLIDYIVDENYEKMADSEKAKIYLKEIMEILPPEGYMICRFMLRDMNINEVAKKIKETVTKTKVMFYKSVRKPVMEAKKLDFL